MKKLFLLLTGTVVAVSMSFGVGFDPKTPSLTIDQVAAGKTVVVDGVVDSKDAWATTWVTMTGNKSANTTSAITAKFQLTYSQKYLWLVAECDGDATVDTSTATTPNTWENDCFEVFVKVDTNSNWANKGKYMSGDYQFRDRRGTIWPDRADAPANFMKAASGFKVGQVDAGSTFVQEWQMPWDSLKKPIKTDTAKFLGNYIKFTVQAADNTTGKASGRTQQLFWQDNSDNQWDDSRTFSLVYMKTKVGVKAAPSVENVSLVSNVVSKQLRLTKAASGVVVNISGQQVATLRNANTLDVSNLSSGVYFLKTNNASMKFIVR